MAIYINTAEGGTNGATVTTSNSGGSSGDAFDQVTANVTFNTSAATHGSLGYYTSVSTTQFVRWSFAASTVLARSYIKVADPLVGTTFMYMALTTGTVSLYTTQTIGRLQLRAGGSNVATSPSSISANTVYRIELYIKSGSGNAEAHVAVYLGDSTTPWWDSGAITGLTIDSLVRMYYGKYDVSSTAVSWDNIGLKTGNDAVWGAWPVANGPLTAKTSKYITVSPGATFTLNGLGSSGSIVSWAWAAQWPSSGAPALTNGNTSIATGTAGSDGDVYVYRLTITDSSANTSTANVNVIVLAAGGGGSSSYQELVWTGSTWK